MSWFSNIGRAIGSGFKHIFSWFSPENEAKAQAIVVKILSMLDTAMPVVNLVEGLIPNPIIPAVVTALRDIGITAEQILGGMSALESQRAKQLLAMALLKNKLLELVASGGHIEMDGGVILKTVDDVLGLAPQQLEAAVSSANAVFKLLQKDKTSPSIAAIPTATNTSQ